MDENKQLVSIVVPIYNMENHISKSIDFLCKQTYPFIEVILVDDASTDNSLKECLKYKEEYDNIVLISLKENKGAGNARNVGIEIAKGDYIFFPDIDDDFSVYLVEKMMNIVNDNSDCDLVVFGYDVYAGDGSFLYQKKYLNKYFTGDEVRQNYHLHMDMSDELGIQGAPWNKFFKLDIIKQRNVRYPDIRRHQDEVFIMRYVQYVNSVYFVNDVLYTYQFNSLDDKIRKFPDNYFDIVLKLDEYRKRYMIALNPNNDIVKRNIDIAYILGIYNGLELATANRKDYKFVKQCMMEYLINKNITHLNNYISSYQRIGIFFINHKCFVFAFWFMKFKFFVQRRLPYLFRMIRKKRQ